MTVADRAERAKVGLHLTRPAADFELSHFLLKLSAVPEVVRLGYSNGTRQVDLWVFVGREDFEVNERIYAIHDEARDVADPEGIELHIIPLDHVSDDALPAYRELW